MGPPRAVVVAVVATLGAVLHRCLFRLLGTTGGAAAAPPGSMVMHGAANALGQSPTPLHRHKVLHQCFRPTDGTDKFARGGCCYSTCASIAAVCWCMLPH
jgi:hypothetical protein